MSSWSLLLRLLLSVLLAANGVATAVAATHLPAAHASAASDGMAGQGGCHDASPPVEAVRAGHGSYSGPAAQALPAHADTGMAHAGVHLEHSAPAPADCCESGACRCDCVPAAQEIAVYWNGGQAVMAEARIFPAAIAAHASPLLPHLIRPPIG